MTKHSKGRGVETQMVVVHKRLSITAQDSKHMVTPLQPEWCPPQHVELQPPTSLIISYAVWGLMEYNVWRVPLLIKSFAYYSRRLVRAGEPVVLQMFLGSQLPSAPDNMLNSQE